MAQASFLYYNPETGNDSRQHDLFTPQPSAILKSSPMPPQDGGMQHLYMPSIARPVNQKLSILGQEPHVLSVETEFHGLEDAGYPRTPDLSACSAISTPPHSSFLPTPTSAFFEGLTGVKEGCEQDVKSEILASFDFRAGSPPLTPVFVNPPNVTAVCASQASELLSTSSCPSLSPSPSPTPQSSFASQQCLQQSESFCDPRNLLVSSRSTTLINQLDIPTLPAFIPSNDDLLLGCVPAKEHSPLEPLPPVVDTVPFFDDFADLESDSDFITDLSQESMSCIGNKRQRMDSIPFSEDLSESSFTTTDEDWSTSPLSDASEYMSTSKRVKMEDGNVDFDFGSSFAGGNAEASTVSVSNGNAQESQDAAVSPAGGDPSTPAGQQAHRRGRKQSLTDDPSKTFVCTLCGRRFRRQEHLKRHYRSLHTEDKPFECSDCGKKFSRSDNLAQHARTHGNPTTIVGLTMPQIDERMASMGDHLYETAAGISSSASSNGSDDEKMAAAKKRKRDE